MKAGATTADRDRRDANRLEIIVKMIADLGRRLQGISLEAFYDDGDERDLTAFRLSVIGENANELSEGGDHARRRL